MTGLDDPDALERDASGMFGRIAEVGAELVRAWELTAELELPAGRTPTAVIVAGVGGSATAGDYFAALCLDSSEIPVSVARGYALPHYVSDRSFVIVSSYSGNTEESLSCYDDAWKRGAALLAVTTGGKLASRAKNDGVPVYQISYKSPPRAAIAHSLAPLLRLGAQLALCAVDDDIVRAAGQLHSDLVRLQLGPQVPAGKNLGKRLAGELRGRFPLVIGAEHLAPAAARFKNQLAENGKMLGAAESLPEAGHNLIVGLGTGGQLAASLAVVMLQSELYDPRIRKRFAIVAGLFDEAGIPVHLLDIPGQTMLEQLAAATAFGDYTSCYLALLNGEDPTPIPQIERLRSALSQ